MLRYARKEHKPRQSLPLPERQGLGFLRKAVIDAECALHNEQSLRDIVRRADCKFLDPCVNEQSSNLQSVRFIACAGIGEPLHGSPFAEDHDMRLRNRKSRRSQDEHNDGKSDCSAAMNYANQPTRLSRKLFDEQVQMSHACEKLCTKFDIAKL